MVGIVDRAKGTVVPADIALRRGNTEEIQTVSRLYDHNDVVTLLETRLLQYYRNDNDSVSLAYKIAVMHVVPNVRFSETATAQAVATAVDAIPLTIGYVQENERVVSKHERITAETRLKLESLRRIKVERGPASDNVLQLIGTIAARHDRHRVVRDLSVPVPQADLHQQPQTRAHCAAHSDGGVRSPTSPANWTLPPPSSI